MMRRHKINMRDARHWMLLLLAIDLFFIFLVWLTSQDSFGSIVLIILLFTVIIILTGSWIDWRLRLKKVNAMQTFISTLSEEDENRLFSITDESWHPVIQELSAQLREQSGMIRDKQMELREYQEFIEAWAHQIKTPLSLAVLVLDNHKDDMSPYVYKRMEHVQHTVNSDVELILYYARLQAAHVDYKFQKLNLKDCVQGCLEDFTVIADEKNITLDIELSPLTVVSDKKVLPFLLSQLLSNAFKYTAADGGIVRISDWQDHIDESIHLMIWNNGKGVPLEDLPFLFDKGFTGNHTQRQNATGMGLYLLKKYTEMLSIEVHIEQISTMGNGFGIQLIFPKVI